ncbi:Protein dopey-1 [Bulinus truncatus]|nr:Protein dopey-1 [Bulinus truncatus]
MEDTSPSLSSSDGSNSALKPFRILISLLDKPEIGPVIIENVLLSVFRRLKMEALPHFNSDSSRQSVTVSPESKLPLETLKTANLLFGSFEPYFLWDYIARIFSASCEQKQTESSSGEKQNEHPGEVASIEEICSLVGFLLDVISLDVYPETTTEHLPDLLRQIISALTAACDHLSEAEVTTSLKLCSKLLSQVQPSMAGHGLERSHSVDTGDSISVFSNDVQLDGSKDQDSYISLKGEKNVHEDSHSKADVAKDKEENVFDKNSSIDTDSKMNGSPSGSGDQFDTSISQTPAVQVDSPNFTKAESISDNQQTLHDKSCLPTSFSDTAIVNSDKASIAVLTSNTRDSGFGGSSITVASDVPELSSSAKQDEFSDSVETVRLSDKIIGNLNKPNTAPSMTNVSNNNNKLFSGHINLMQLCVQSFQQFFNRFCLLRILKSADFCQSAMEYINAESACNSSNADEQNISDLSTVPNCHSKLQLEAESDEAKQAYKQACRLLLDFASFPIYCTDYQAIIDEMGSKEESSTLPPWLQTLLICSCSVDCFEVQSSSISTLLDLIHLTQSVQTERENKTRHHGRQSFSEGRVSVVILPALLPSHLVYINTNTKFYQIVAAELWGYLCEKFNLHHQRAVELFHTLHQVTHNASICEDVIGRALISESEIERISAFKKFSILWHLTRSIKTEPNPSRSPRTFDRSMFVVLDSLKEESSITKTLATTWLTHVIQRGDTSRVLHPLLFMLLHPDTARISIQHVSVHKPKKILASEKGDEDIESKIYAISSEGGNVIYHLSQNKVSSFSKGKPGIKSTDDLKSYAMSVMNNKGSHSVAPVRTHSVTDLSFERVNPENVKIRINPFGSESSLDKLIFDGYEFPQSASMPNLEGVKRLNADTCLKEGIFFDGADVNEDHFSKEDAQSEEQFPEVKPPEEKEDSLEVFDDKDDNQAEYTAEEIVVWVLDGIIASAVNEAAGDDADFKSGSGLGMEQSYISPSLDDLRKIDVDSNSGSEIDDVKAFSSSTADLNLRMRLSSNNLRDGSTESLANQDSDNSSRPLMKDPRELDPSTDIHELHMHMLLYTQQYDYRRTLYALSTLRTMLHNCPRLVVTAMATTSISSVRAPHLAKLQSLLGRHRKSVFGKNFFGDLPQEVMASYRSNMLVEIVISLCLYFIRGYYPNLMVSKLTHEELLGNKMVHILGVEILTLMVSELLSIMKESGKNFVSYISDLLSRCKLQKSLLHCLLASVYNQGHGSSAGKVENLKLTELIIDFNENGLDPSVNDTFQMKLLQLVLVTVMLEDQIRLAQGAVDSQSGAAERPHLTSSLLNVHYNANLPIIQQEMFLSAVWSALKQYHLCHLHRHWIGLVTSALPYMGRAMARTVLCVVLQLCRNLDIIALDLAKKKSSMQRVPPDHVVSMLEGLTTLCHYCLLDNTSPVSIGQPAPTSTIISTETASAGQILTNLIHVFNPVTSGKEPSPARDSAPMSPVLDARARLLGTLPRIMACMATLWKAVAIVSEDGSAYITSHPTVGDFKAVRQHILELLSPISLPHGTNLLAAFAVAWNDRRQTPKKNQVSPAICEDQLLLVELVSAIKVLPMDTLIQTVKQVIKQPPQTETKKGLPLEVNLLQFFFAYVRNTTTIAQLLDSWPSLLSLLRECLQMNLSPPALFLLLQILHEFVQKTPTMEEKKNQKDLQDICQKTLESISAISGSSLEQTTWLRRNFAVKPGPQNVGVDELDGQEDTDLSEVKKESTAVKTPVRSQASDSKYSVQALVLMAELTASILDVIYSSEEKDKVAPFLTTLLYNVFPYLRHHSSHNVPSYRACSQMLSSISGYQYTRRAWRKEAFELLMEPSFFQMDVKSISYWCIIIDNLMTHDKTTFKDLMGRVSITQTGSLNLFSSKEQEYEQRTQMIKRLAFTIFCSETDQYQRAMPDIQERLAEGLRLPSVPNVLSSVFLCFRVLILRMSPQHLTSLWPTIITEMVQVLLQVEQELSTETDEFKTQIQRIAALDSSWAHLGNGLNAHNNPAWLQLYLSVCKLLDMCIVMPADQVPQFQLYRWAFVGTAGEDDYPMNEDSNDFGWRPNPLFTPHIIRLSRLLNNRMKKKPTMIKSEPGRPLLTMHKLQSLADLQSFFYTVRHSTEGHHSSNKHSASKTAGILLDKLHHSKLTAERLGNWLKLQQKFFIRSCI